MKRSPEILLRDGMVQTYLILGVIKMKSHYFTSSVRIRWSWQNIPAVWKKRTSDDKGKSSFISRCSSGKKRAFKVCIYFSSKLEGRSTLWVEQSHWITVSQHHTQPVFPRNEMNIQIPLCNVWHLNGSWRFLWKSFRNDALTGKKFKILRKLL